MDQWIRKLMTMNKALHPRNDIDRLYMSRKRGDLPTLKLASMHLFKDSNNTLKRAKKDFLYRPEAT